MTSTVVSDYSVPLDQSQKGRDSGDADAVREWSEAELYISRRILAAASTAVLKFSHQGRLTMYCAVL